MQDLDRLRALGDPDRAARASARHKRGRETLGVPPAQIEALAAEWRAALDIAARVALARTFWDSDIHEARLTAARLLVQARMRPDDGAWDAILDWAPQIDGQEIGDGLMSAASRRLVTDPARLDRIAPWAGSRNPWLRRGLLVATGPWAKMNNPKPQDLEIRETVLAWALTLSTDRNGAVRQAAQAWIRDLAKHDPDRAALWQQSHEDRVAAQAEARAAAEDEAEMEPEDLDDANATPASEGHPDTGSEATALPDLDADPEAPDVTPDQER
ncbi:DNA alkylation repair protein [Paracoccus liaowanqingii]|uniref:DNA alkylation repair protein n=1 Tax=Paracoccus liaowanqingii TaxID=2560053 RepID=A0A4Z1CAQ1_9RHOB|nr:DNA alkylation repair protein [Paracoccus liaowanqingii]TGN55484.1 DNA alkylation repair protein [Paracoccus liaowanqingii]